MEDEDFNSLCRLLELQRCSVLVVEGGGGGKLTASGERFRILEAARREVRLGKRSVMGGICLSMPFPEFSLVAGRFDRPSRGCTRILGQR